MKKSLIFLIFFISFLTRNSIAQIDTTTINKFTVYVFLTSQDSTKEEMALKYIADSTSVIEPHTLMMAGMMLYTKGYKDSGMFWLYFGDIRARFLSSLYKQRSNAALYSSFHAIAMQLTQDYAKNNSQMLYKKIDQALEFDSLNPLKPILFLEPKNDTSQYIPIEEWKQYYEVVRQTYYHLKEEILLNGSSIFEEGTKNKTKPK